MAKHVGGFPHEHGDAVFTPEDIRDVMGTALVAGSNISITPDDVADTITISTTGVTAEDVMDILGAGLVSGNNIDITYDDPGNAITIAVEPLTVSDITDISVTASAINTVVGSGGVSTSALTLLGSQTFSAQSSLVLDGVFSTAYDQYLIQVTGLVTSASAVLFAQLRSGGTSTNPATDYGWSYTTVDTSGTEVHAGGTGATHVRIAPALGSGITAGHLAILVNSPGDAVKTSFEFRGAANLTTTTGSRLDGNGFHVLTTAYDGIQILPLSGNISGTIRVFGYQKTVGSGPTGYNDEAAQDTIGSILVDSSTIDFTYNDATPSITASVIQSGLTLSSIGGSVTDAQVPNTITLDNITQITTRSHTSLTDIGTNTHPAIDTHIASTSNPHSVTKTQVGLGNADNTSDASKPVSTAQQTALDLKANDADVVHDTGAETIAGVKTFSSDPIIPDEAYGAGWDTSLEPPTKNAVYDKFESLVLGGGGYTNEEAQDAVGTILTDSSTVNFTYTDATPEITAVVIESGLTLSNISGSVTDAQVPNTITLDNLNQITTRSHTVLSDIGTNTHAQIDTHIGSTSNPHSTTAAQVGAIPTIADPNADRMVFWDDSAGAYAYLTPGTNLTITGTTIDATGGSGTGDVLGPASATDNAIVRFDGTGGKTIQDSSGATLSDNGNLVLPAGAAAAGRSPLKLTSGTLNTTPEAGAMEYDGNLLYFTPTASNRLVFSNRAYVRIDAARNLIDDASVQPLFPTTEDSLTVIAGMTYRFKAVYDVTKGANSVSVRLNFGGSATFTTFKYAAIVRGAAAGASATAVLASIATSATTVVAAAGTALNWVFVIEGEFEVNAGGTLTPAIALSAVSGTVPTVNIGTWFEAWMTGPNPVTKIGPWS